MSAPFKEEADAHGLSELITQARSHEVRMLRRTILHHTICLVGEMYLPSMFAVSWGEGQGFTFCAFDGSLSVAATFSFTAVPRCCMGR